MKYILDKFVSSKYKMWTELWIQARKQTIYQDYIVAMVDGLGSIPINDSTYDVVMSRYYLLLLFSLLLMLIPFLLCQQWVRAWSDLSYGHP